MYISTYEINKEKYLSVEVLLLLLEINALITIKDNIIIIKIEKPYIFLLKNSYEELNNKIYKLLYFKIKNKSELTIKCLDFLSHGALYSLLPNDVKEISSFLIKNFHIFPIVEYENDTITLKTNDTRK